MDERELKAALEAIIFASGEPVPAGGVSLGLGGAGALLLGGGMCLSMVVGKLVAGIVVGLIGIVALLLLIPLAKGLKD